MKISELFDLKQGNSFELMDMGRSKKSNINFVSRASTNNGVTGIVDEIDSCPPFEAGLLTVALSGNGVCSTFVQTNTFYTAYHVMVLKSKKKMTFNEKMYYAMCIKFNAYRYAWGRQANKTLKSLELPDKIPDWVYSIHVKPISTSINVSNTSLNVSGWKEFNITALFDIKRGTRITKEYREEGIIPLVTAGFQNQGIAELISSNTNQLYSNVITIDMFGNAFFRNYKFYCDDNILVLNNKSTMSKYTLLFIVTVINSDKYRYSYGRQYRQKDVKTHFIKLPISCDGTPDWNYMENYIESLPYSDRI